MTNKHSMGTEAEEEENGMDKVADKVADKAVDKGADKHIHQYRQNLQQDLMDSVIIVVSKDIRNLTASKDNESKAKVETEGMQTIQETSLKIMHHLQHRHLQ